MPILTYAEQLRFCNCYKVEGNFMTDEERKNIKRERRELISRWEKFKKQYDIH